MKKRIIFLLTLVLSVSMMLSTVAYARHNCEPLEIIRYEDGTYLEVTLESSYIRASNSLTKTKNYVYRYSDGSAVWKLSLTGSFVYTGTSSICTSSSCNVTIYDDNWYVVSKSATKSSATARCTATMGYNYQGNTMKKTFEITLTCDKNGNVS